MKERTVPELVLPAGSLRKLRMAYAYGADAAYVGAAGFSMRPDESSFTVEQLAEGSTLAREQGKKLYAGINCLMLEADLAPLGEWLEATRDIALDAVIVADIGALSLAREMRPDLPVHISTQMSTANSKAAAFLKHQGARRVVLARECSLAATGTIAQEGGIEVEIFVHGAMCVAVSGRCLLSAHLCGQSGSKGQCKHSCRWEWQLVESQRPGEAFPVYETGRGTMLMGSTDLCLIEHIPSLVKSGVRALKVEGRMKSEYYVAAVARVYRAALDAYAASPADYAYDPAWMTELESVSHRPFSPGFAFGYPSDRPDSLQAKNRAESTHDVIGYIEKRNAAGYTVDVKNPFIPGDDLEWIGPGWRQGQVKVGSISGPGDRPAGRAHCGTTVEAAFVGDVEMEPLMILRRKR